MGVLALVACLAQGASPTREERVLALLQEVACGGSFRYADARFREIEAPMGAGPVLQDELMLFCGNADSGTFDDRLARRIGVECLRIYGFEAAVDVDVETGGGCASIDGLDRAKRVGFELTGLGCRETFCEAKVEAPERALALEEAQALAEQGYRLHVAEVAGYRSASDDFTPTLAWVAGLVRFLNAVTEGEDVELGGLLFEREREWRVPFAPTASVRAQTVNGRTELRVTAKLTLRYSCDGAATLVAPELGRGSFLWEESSEERLARQALPFPASGGAAAVLLLEGAALGLEPGEDVPPPEFTVRVRQWVAGVEQIQEAHALVLLLPSRFDLSRPFELELDLGPGRYVFGSACLGSAAPR